MKGEFRQRPRCSPTTGQSSASLRSRYGARGRSEMLPALVKDPPSNEADIEDEEDVPLAVQY